MIFNSISKELASNHLSKKEYFPADYQPPFQPGAGSHLKRSNLLHSRLETSEKSSALSQMNQRITDNLEYLKYKDSLRHNQLKMSRISNKSNTSNRSNHSLKSQRSAHSIKSRSNVYATENSRYSFKTNPNEHYFPPFKTAKPEFDTWEKSKFSRTQHQNSSSDSCYRQFLRKPITIEDYGQKYGYMIENRRPEKDIETYQLPSTSLKSPLSYNFNPQERFPYTSSLEPDQLHPATTPTSREWINSFSNNFQKQTKTTQPLPPVAESTPRIQQIENPVKSEERVSPLQVSPKRPKEGMIVAFGLVGLGLLLFILQILK